MPSAIGYVPNLLIVTISLGEGRGDLDLAPLKHLIQENYGVG